MPTATPRTANPWSCAERTELDRARAIRKLPVDSLASSHHIGPPKWVARAVFDGHTPNIPFTAQRASLLR